MSSPEITALTPEQEAQQTLLAAAEKRRQAFVEKYAELCKEYGHEMQPLIQITPAGIQSFIQPVQVK